MSSISLTQFDSCLINYHYVLICICLMSPENVQQFSCTFPSNERKHTVKTHRFVGNLTIDRLITSGSSSGWCIWVSNCHHLRNNTAWQSEQKHHWLQWTFAEHTFPRDPRSSAEHSGLCFDRTPLAITMVRNCCTANCDTRMSTLPHLEGSASCTQLDQMMLQTRLLTCTQHLVHKAEMESI